MMKNTFYFYLNALFCSQDLEIFVLNFWSCRKNCLIRNISLKELQTYNHYKNSWKHNQHAKLLFFKIKLHFGRLNIYIWKTKFSSHKQYLFDLLCFRNAHKNHTDQKMLKLFYSVCKKRLTSLLM